MSDRRSNGTRWWSVALLAFVNLSVVGLVWFSLDAGYRQYQERARISSRNTCRLVAQTIAGDIDRIDLALNSVRDEVDRLLRAGARIETATMDGFLTRLQARLSIVDAVRIANTEGLVVAGSGGVPPDIRIDDRDYFEYIRKDPRAGLVISPPVLGRLSGKWVLIFAHRINRLDGSFGGVVIAPVTTDWFEHRFQGLDVGPTGVVVLRGDASRDFDLLARIPHSDDIGQTRVSDTFRRLTAAQPEGGTYEAAAGNDGIHRTFTFRPVGTYPLVTLVGLATDDYLGEWRRDAAKLVALAGAFMLVTTLGGVGILRTWAALERRTAELARSNADLEQFAYVASHDLQTPLRNIASYAQLLAKRYKGRLDPDADEFIGYIVGGARQMSSMIPALLNYARVSTVPPKPQPVDLGLVMATVRGTLGSAVAAAGGELVVGPLPVVLAEAHMAESLLQNLVGNALVYRAPERPPRIEVAAEPTPDGMWRIAVRDNGIGIEKQYQEKIFVIFQRLDPQAYPGGTGIGLAVCRRIVDRFGGRIWVESEPGKGTTIYFTLPAAD